MTHDPTDQYLPRGEFSFLSLSIGAMIRVLYYRLRGMRPVRVGHCKQCGACCRNLHLFHRGKWIQTRRQFKRMIAECPEYERFEIMDDPGMLLLFSCRFLSEDNICQDYENRPSACLEYPTLDLHLRSKVLYPNCGYSFKMVKDFGKTMKAVAHIQEQAEDKEDADE
ncbi:MAG: YkgJ family cysteine cluster protein [Desulfovibrio sp.]|uniref:YkgJ family cysteine cluster protein n=1 Tax=Desulfovibrio sp. 7SRBS1 TaxID=3378064 RepID=UPI003B406DDC